MFTPLLLWPGTKQMLAGLFLSNFKTITALGKLSLYLVLLFTLSSTQTHAQSVPASDYANLTNVNGILYFTARNVEGQSCLWKSNGTPAGTVLIKAIDAANITLFKGSVYFSANENYTTGYEIWKTDGTPAGTVKVTDAPWKPLDDWAGYGISRAKIVLKATDNFLYFTANNDFLDFELWRTDGTSTGSLKLKTVNLYYDRRERIYADFISEGSILYFSSENGLGKTDGTLQGTTMLYSNQAPYKHVKLLSLANGTLYFSKWDTSTFPKGYNIYKKNIASPNIEMAVNLSAESIDQIEFLGSSLFVDVAEEFSQNYAGLYKHSLNANNQYATQVYQGSVSCLTKLGNTLYFYAYGVGLYKINETDETPTLVKQLSGLIQQIVVSGNIFYFAYGTELWRSDGTASGTYLVKDIIPGGGYSSPQNLVNINGILYFTATDGTEIKLWKSNSTTAGTVAINFPVIVTDPMQAPSKQWDKTFGGTGDNNLETAIATSDGGYLLAGHSYSESTTSDYWVVKTSANGNKVWDKTYGGSFLEYLYGVVATADGGYLLAGTSYSDISGDKTAANKGDADYWLVKVDANGNKIWDKTYGGANADVPYTIIATAEGDFLIAGLSYSGISGDKTAANKGDADYWLVKVDANGNKIWDKTYGGANSESIKKILPTANGGYLLAGTSNSGISGDKTQASRGGNDYWILQINKDGVKQADRTFGGGRLNSQQNDVLVDVVLMSDGGYLVGGSSNSPTGADKSASTKSGDDFWIIKLDNNLNKVWDKIYGGKYLTNGNNNDYLTSIIKPTDGGFVLAGYSNANPGNDKTEESRGSLDYWMVKINNAGIRQWNKTFGGNREDELKSAIQTTDGGFLLAGTSNSGLSGDKTEPNNGLEYPYDFWVIKTYPENTSVSCSATGNILREVWSNVTGSAVSAIPVNTPSTNSSQLTSFEAPSNVDNSYGQRLRGYICPPITGNYTFYIAADNNAELWLSSDDDPAKKTKIAHISGDLAWTPVRVWNKYPTQKSASIALVAGKKYYVEALHKENGNGDNLAVAWVLPNTSAITVIPGSSLSPYVPSGSGKIARELWNNVPGAVISAIPVSTPATSTGELTSFEAPSNIANSYGQRLRGYLHPQLSGNYTFYIAGDNNAELYLSTDDDAAKKVRIAHISGDLAWTPVRIWNKYSTQKSVSIALVAGRKYYVEALHKENGNGDNLAVAWTLPGTSAITVIAGSYLSPFTTTNSIARIGQEQVLTEATHIKVYPNPFESKLILQNTLQGKLQVNVADNLGRLVYQATHLAEASEVEIDLSKANLKAGVYFVSIQTQDGQTKVVRVLKK